MVAPAVLLGIDWGSTARRAYVIGADGQCQQQWQDSEGALQARGAFAASLQALRATLALPDQVPVVMSGMVGSAQGWQEAPYLDSSLPLSSLPAQLMPVGAAAHCHIVPGYRYRSDGAVDVMRGEETQLLGALALGHGDGWIVLPGTHSKWVELSSGRIVRFMTYITGELFAGLRAGGTLAALMAEGDAVPAVGPGADVAGLATGAAGSAGAGAAVAGSAVSDSAFSGMAVTGGAGVGAAGSGAGVADAAAAGALLSGAQRAQALEPLSHTLFEARARVVAGGQPARLTRDFVSGLLIGTEFAAQRALLPGGSPVVSLLGAPALCALYARVARQLDIGARLIDPGQAYCAALRCFMEHGLE
jgi:2-dehydro-3-deoxygalactonokinase